MWPFAPALHVAAKSCGRLHLTLKRHARGFAGHAARRLRAFCGSAGHICGSARVGGYAVPLPICRSLNHRGDLIFRNLEAVPMHEVSACTPTAA